MGIKAVLNLDGWIRDAFRRNMPYDQFVHAIVTARGSTFEQGPATIFRDRREPEEIAPMVSQLFLGIRLECAKCHHHPFESWDQAQFYEFAAYFARVGRKGTGLSPPISGSEEIVYTAKSGSVKHPLTGKVLAPRALFGSAPVSDDPDADPREALARWMIAPENPYFARVIVNRVWAEIMGRGIVDPVDDLRATNPPSNGPLLDALADDFRRHGYDLKHLIGTILSSSVYALSSEPNERNVADTRNFSRHYRQRLRAEVLLDAISDVTGVPDTFAAAPARLARRGDLDAPRALAVPRHVRPARPEPGPALRTHGRHVGRPGAAPHERAGAAQESHQRRRTAPRGSPAASNRRARSSRNSTCSPTPGCPPTRSWPSECRSSRAPGPTAVPAVEDLMWALINSAEFVFKD